MSWFGWMGEAKVPAHAPSPDRERTLALYKYDSCPYCQRVLRKISALGLDVEMRDTMMEPARRRELQQATGRTQVPALFIDGEPLFESDDINAWLDAYAKRDEPAAAVEERPRG